MLGPRRAGACLPCASEPCEGQALALQNWRMAQSVCSLSLPELKQNPRYTETNQNYVLSQKRLVVRSAGACLPRASESCEGQALALRNPATVQSLVAEECKHYEQKSA